MPVPRVGGGVEMQETPEGKPMPSESTAREPGREHHSALVPCLQIRSSFGANICDRNKPEASRTLDF